MYVIINTIKNVMLIVYSKFFISVKGFHTYFFSLICIVYPPSLIFYCLLAMNIAMFITVNIVAIIVKINALDILSNIN